MYSKIQDSIFAELRGIRFDSDITVYIGGPLFDIGSQMYNDLVANVFKVLGANVYVPQESTEINDKSNGNITGELIYKLDNEALAKCDYVYSHYNETQDPGLIWEMCRAINNDIKVAVHYDDCRLLTKPNPEQSGFDNQSMYINQYVVGAIKSEENILGGFLDIASTIRAIYDDCRKNKNNKIAMVTNHSI